MNSYLDRLSAELGTLIASLDEDRLRRAPARKWTSAQILEHLYLTYTNTNKGIAKCLSHNAPFATRATIRQRLRQFVVLGFSYLPEGAKAPERAVPRGASTPSEVRSNFLTELQKMATGFDDCERRLGAKVKLFDHPMLGPLDADEWRKFHWLHGQLHARQIRQRCSLGSGTLS